MSSKAKDTDILGMAAKNAGEVRDLHVIDDDADVVISFEHVFKEYRLYSNDRGRFLDGILGMRRNRHLVDIKYAVNDLSFEVRRGESVALLGRNGAGKSTTLKLISGVCHPTSGIVTVDGRISALLELTAGYDSKLTGRENIRMRGLIAGMDNDRIAEVEARVEEFSELGIYMDQPVRSYSSGMRSRLGFGFAVAIDPQILIVDETLSVGDKAFRRKCSERVHEIMRDSQVTVLLVTHTTDIARDLCARGMVLEEGRLVYEGDVEGAVERYESQ